jgi:hypothetical protein
MKKSISTFKKFDGKFNYTYKETGYNEHDFTQVYDKNIRSIDCTLKLPNSEGKYVLEMTFETPDKKHKNFVCCDLKNIVLNGSDLFFLGIHFNSYVVENSTLLIKGDFILEIKDELDGFHLFDFTLELDNEAVLPILLKNKLI